MERGHAFGIDRRQGGGMGLVFRCRLINVHVRREKGRLVYVLNNKIQIKILWYGGVVLNANDQRVIPIPVLGLIVLEIRKMRRGKVQVGIIAAEGPIRIRGDTRSIELGKIRTLGAEDFKVFYKIGVHFVEIQADVRRVVFLQINCVPVPENRHSLLRSRSDADESRRIVVRIDEYVEIYFGDSGSVLVRKL